MNDRKIFVIGDTHFGHKNILRFTWEDGTPIRPGFANIQEHDEMIVECWNSVVRPHDIVYHLGDVYFGNAEYVDGLLSRLNGRKRLILGNHDNGKSPVLQKHFQKIVMWRMFPEYNCVLTHVPIYLDETYKGKYQYNVHGHIHQRDAFTPRHINASCEAVKYTPVDLEEIMKGKY